MRLFNDYADIEHKVRKEPVKHELFASIAIPFHEGYDLLARTTASLTQGQAIERLQGELTDTRAALLKTQDQLNRALSIRSRSREG